MKFKLILLLLFSFGFKLALAQEWQWSAPVDGMISTETNAAPKAFLWIPPGCKQVRGVIIGQHNMLEEGIFEHPAFRKAMSDIDFAEIWITPGPDFVFNFNRGIGDVFAGMLKKLGEVSGYTELRFAAVIPIGHSAAASYPWNFAAWNPGRTLAILSVHGDAPLTSLTGSGQPNPDWANRTIEGVPGLMIMGECEWWEKRLSPAMAYRQKYPAAPISLLADAGHGHFDYSDQLVNYLALFIRKAAAARLPAKMPLDTYPVLKAIDPQNGWLADRWHPDSLPHAAPAPYAGYRGDRSQAFWYFDQEMADATEKYYTAARGKKPEYIGFLQDGHLLKYNLNLHARIMAQWQPLSDGLSFHLSAAYTDTLRTNLAQDHAVKPINITRICGPVVKINDTTFAVRFYRMGFDNPKRSGDIWLLASSPGDANYKSTVQQLDMHIPVVNKEGTDQIIDFPAIPNRTKNSKPYMLQARSSSGMPVYYYVEEGPAALRGNVLTLTQIPPRAKYPLKVTVVAWQYGRSVEPKIKSAAPVTRSFYITAPVKKN